MKRVPRWRELRLRTRLVALVLAMVTLAFALVALVTVIQLHGFLVRRLDQQLAAAGGRYAASLEHSDRDADDTRQFNVTGQAEGTLGARIKAGSVTAAHVVGRDNDDNGQPDARARAILAQLHPARRAISRRLPELGEYRLLVLRGNDGDVLVTGLPMHSVEETTHHLIAIEAFVFGGTLLAVGLMNLPWMLLVTALIFLEKIWSQGTNASCLLGAALIFFGLLAFVDPSLLPGLYAGHF